MKWTCVNVNITLFSVRRTLVNVNRTPVKKKGKLTVHE